jgi:uncharacterized membrane protein
MGIDIGPVQLIVYAFDSPKFGGGIAAELKRLKEQDIVRVVDALVVYKNAEGEVRNIQVTDLSEDQAEMFGAVIGGLIGLGRGGEAGMEAGAAAGMQAVSDQDGHIFDPDHEMWDVLDDIPSDTAAALILLEHRWAIPLRDAILEEGGMAVGDLWLHPRDLVAAGIIAGEAAEYLNGKYQAAA